VKNLRIYEPTNKPTISKIIEVLGREPKIEKGTKLGLWNYIEFMASVEEAEKAVDMFQPKYRAEYNGTTYRLRVLGGRQVYDIIYMGENSKKEQVFQEVLHEHLFYDALVCNGQKELWGYQVVECLEKLGFKTVNSETDNEYARATTVFME